MKKLLMSDFCSETIAPQWKNRFTFIHNLSLWKMISLIENELEEFVEETLFSGTYWISIIFYRRHITNNASGWHWLTDIKHTPMVPWLGNLSILLSTTSIPYQSIHKRDCYHFGAPKRSAGLIYLTNILSEWDEKFLDRTRKD